MRARNIKPGLFLNEVLGQADPFLTILFQGLWCLADREGRLEDRPLRIKAEVFPYREGLDVNGYLTELERCGFIERYQVGAVKVIQVLNFTKHQSPHNTEKASELPEKPSSCPLTVDSPLPHGGNPPDSLIPDSLIPDSNTTLPPSAPVEVLGSPRKPKGRVRLSLIRNAPDQQAFETLWAEWPREREGKPARGEKPKAEACFQEILNGGEVSASELLAAGRLYLAEDERVKAGFPKMVSSFFALKDGFWRSAVKLHRHRVTPQEVAV